MSLAGHDWRTCELCGHGANEPAVAPTMMYAQLPEGRQFLDVIRCKDREACRDRAAAGGRDWPEADPAELKDERLAREVYRRRRAAAEQAGG